MVSTMCDLTCGVFEHLEITSTMDVNQRISYTQRLLRGAALKKYKSVLMECKESAKDIPGEQVDPRKFEGAKEDGIDNNGDTYPGLDK